MAGGAGERARTWDLGRRASAWSVRLPRAAPEAFAQVRAWAQAEVAPGRLMPWLPIAFGAGIVLYFTAEREPALVAGPAAFAAVGIMAFFARARPIAFSVLLMFAALAAGFSAA